MGPSVCGSAIAEAAPPPPGPPDGGAHDTVFYGVVICEAAVTFIALGANIQRYGLTQVSPAARWCGCCSLANVVWFGGLLTYFLGNILFFAALSLAPASLCAALLATVVVSNAVVARVLLKERLQRCDYHGGAFIVAGIALTATFAPYVTIAYDAREVVTLVSDLHGALYSAFLVFLALTLATLVLYHERQHAHDSAAAVCIEGVPVPRTRPCAPSPTLELGAKGRPTDAAGGSAAKAGGGIASLRVACTVVPPAVELASAPPSPPATPQSANKPAHALTPPAALAPSLEEATTSVAGGARPARGEAGSKQPSPSHRAAAGQGFGGGDWSAIHRRKRSCLTQLMPFAYPVILGTLETLVQMCQKAASSMLLLSLEGETQMCHPAFWVAWLCLLVLTVLVIWWLRKGLSHLQSSRLLPVEYGTVTSTSIIGGLVIYQERKYVDEFNLWMMGAGILLIVIGCGLVGRRKTIKKRFDPGYKIAHEYLPRLGANLSQMQRGGGALGALGLHAQHHRCTVGAAMPAERLERSSAALCAPAESCTAPPGLRVPLPRPPSGELPSEVRVDLDRSAATLEDYEHRGASCTAVHVSVAEPARCPSSPPRDAPSTPPSAATDVSSQI